LDVLRLFAALAVVLFHVAASKWGWSSNLYLMVDLFFVLSGFVLAPVFPKHKDLASFRHFVLKRFLRLAPLTWITITFVLGYAGLLEIKHNLDESASTPSMPIDFQAIVLSLLLLQVFSSEATVLNYPLWSLSAEWIVNLAIATLAGLFSTRFYKYFLIGLLLLGLISASSSLDPEWANQICRAAFGISLGILIRYAFDSRARLKGQKFHLVLSSSASLAVVFIRIDYGRYQAICSCLAFAYFIYSLAEFEVGSNFRIPESIARNSGLLSFGIYVWHAPLSGLVSRLFEITQVHYLGIQYLALVLLSSLATLISVKLVEKPTLKAIKGRLDFR
jgi:peptidoglycan/LPS O-acetylase OafA/YrhL